MLKEGQFNGTLETVPSAEIVAPVQQRQDKALLEMGHGEIGGDVPEGWRKLAESNSRALDEMMLMVGKPLNMQVRDLPK